MAYLKLKLNPQGKPMRYHLMELEPREVELIKGTISFHLDKPAANTPIDRMRRVTLGALLCALTPRDPKATSQLKTDLFLYEGD